MKWPSTRREEQGLSAEPPLLPSLAMQMLCDHISTMSLVSFS